MAEVLSFGTNNVAGTDASLDLTVDSLNGSEFAAIQDVPGSYILTDITAPSDQPSTLRIAQRANSNVYAGTDIDPATALVSKKGTDTMIEVREVWSFGDENLGTRRLMPVRMTLSFTIPKHYAITHVGVERLLKRTVAGLALPGNVIDETSIGALLRGVVHRNHA